MYGHKTSKLKRWYKGEAGNMFGGGLPKIKFVRPFLEHCIKYFICPPYFQVWDAPKWAGLPGPEEGGIPPVPVQGAYLPAPVPVLVRWHQTPHAAGEVSRQEEDGGMSHTT